MSDPQLILPQEQIDMIKQKIGYDETTKSFDGNQSWQAYDYIYDLIKDNPQVDNATKTWFKHAAPINRNDPKSAANIHTRALTQYGLELDGKDASAARIQGTSKNIGERVIGDIINQGGIPQFSTMFFHDVQVALKEGGQTPGGWVGAFYYWDLKIEYDGNIATIGDHIKKDPNEYTKFIAVQAAAFNETLRAELLEQPGREAELWTMLTIGTGSDLPWSERMLIIERAIKTSEGESYAGNPNKIDGWRYNEKENQWIQVLGNAWSVSVKEAPAEVAAKLEKTREARLKYAELAKFGDNSNIGKPIINQAVLEHLYEKIRSDIVHYASSIQDRTHQIKTGDTLSQIAETYKVPVSKIAERNGIKDVDKVTIGQTLVIPLREVMQTTLSSENINKNNGKAKNNQSVGDIKAQIIQLIEKVKPFAPLLAPVPLPFSVLPLRPKNPAQEPEPRDVPLPPRRLENPPPLPDFLEQSRQETKLQKELAWQESLGHKKSGQKDIDQFVKIPKQYAIREQYVVKKGDNLSTIARREKTSVQNILALNPNIKDPDKIYTGQAINLPSTIVSQKRTTERLVSERELVFRANWFVDKYSKEILLADKNKNVSFLDSLIQVNPKNAYLHNRQRIVNGETHYAVKFGDQIYLYQEDQRKLFPQPQTWEKVSAFDEENRILNTLDRQKRYWRQDPLKVKKQMTAQSTNTAQRNNINLRLAGYTDRFYTKMRHERNASFRRLASWNAKREAEYRISSLKYDWQRDLSMARGSSQVRFINMRYSGAIRNIAYSSSHVSPLILDLNGDGIKVSALYEKQIFFDIDDDGFKEQVSWVSEDDGLLAVDYNGNGRIDNVTELFGNDKGRAFDKLATYDSNKDGVVNVKDADFSKLLIWQDKNQNGLTDKGEAISLKDAKIKEISIESKPDYYIIKDCIVTDISTFTFSDGTKGNMADVHFYSDDTNTISAEEADPSKKQGAIDLWLATLPNARGYGMLSSLHEAMEKDAHLQHHVEALAFLQPEEFSHAAALAKRILFRWARVDKNDPDARKTRARNTLDARIVDFLEKFGGSIWQQVKGTKLVGLNASVGVKKSWNQIHATFTAQLLIQSTLKDIFPKAQYHTNQDMLILGDNLETILERAKSYISKANIKDKYEFWCSLATILILHKEELECSVEAIKDSISKKSGNNLHIASYKLSSKNGGDIYNPTFGDHDILETNTHIISPQSKGKTIEGTNFGDFIFNLGGKKEIHGKEGPDYIQAGSKGDTIYGDDGNDVIRGSDGDDRIEGGDGHDNIRGKEGNDKIIGGKGSDSVQGGIGADEMDGGEGENSLDYVESLAPVTVNLKTGLAKGGDAEGDTFKNFKNLSGSLYDDTLIGDDDDNAINGEAGNDIIRGGDGNDKLFGAEDDNKLFGEEGHDILTAFTGKNTFDGGPGIDTVNYSDSRIVAPVVVNLKTGRGSLGSAEGDIYISIENVLGSQKDDTIIGDDGSNVFVGLSGNDTFEGNGGGDFFFGGEGADHMDGGDGHDTVFYSNSHKAVYIDLSKGTGKGGEAEGDTFKNIEAIVGSKFDDSFIGNQNNNAFEGGEGADHIDGGEGKDTAIYIHSKQSVNVNLTTGVNKGGEAEGDKLFDIENIIGSAHNDTIIGDENANVFTGGAGADFIDGQEGKDKVLYITSPGGVNIDLATGLGKENHAEGDILENIEYVVGSLHNDTITGSSEDDTLDGSDGDDILFGRGGNDSFMGRSGADHFDGGDGYDIAFYLYSPEAVTINLEENKSSGGEAEGDTFKNVEAISGSKFDDTFIGDKNDNTFEGREGADHFDGRKGHDTVVYANSKSAVTVDLREEKGFGGEAEGDTFENIEAVTGTKFNDVLIGNQSDNFFEGGEGADHMDGKEGFDVATYEGSKQAVTVNLKENNNSTGDAKGDTFKSIEFIVGTTFNDMFIGDDFNNTFEGGEGADHFNGDAGNDTVMYSNSKQEVTISLLAGHGKGGDAKGDTFKNIEDIIGSSHGDTITGDNQKNNLAGNEGNDKLSGEGGNDRLIGGPGADILDGGKGRDTVSYFDSLIAVHVDLSKGIGKNGNAEGDTYKNIEDIEGSKFDDILIGDNNSNIFFARGGNNQIDGKGGGDVVSYKKSPAHIKADLESGIVICNSQKDHLKNIEIIAGSNYDDIFIGGKGIYSIDGDAGRDTVIYSASPSGVKINLATGKGFDGYAEGDLFKDIEVVVGSKHDDILMGGDGDDTLFGGNGDDYFIGSKGIDNMDGEAGQDVLAYSDSPSSVKIDLSAGKGSGGHAEGDIFKNIEVVVGSDYGDILLGGDVGDRFKGGKGADTIDGGKGWDVLVYTDSLSGVKVSFAEGKGSGGEAEGDVFKNIEGVVGSKHDDTLIGDDKRNNLSAEAGNDTLLGKGGNDILDGSEGADHIDGGEGQDQLLYWKSPSGIKVDLTAGKGFGGHAEGDTFKNVENIKGSNHDDILIGDNQANVLEGANGNDKLIGGGGNDILAGGKGKDTIIGGKGTDTCIHALGHGHDVIWNVSKEDKVENVVIILPENMPSERVEIARNNTDLVIYIKDYENSSITVKNHFKSKDLEINSLKVDWSNDPRMFAMHQQKSKALFADKVGQFYLADLLKNDKDAENDKLTVVAVKENGYCDVILKDESIILTPNPGFKGLAQFEYTLEDSQGNTATGKTAVLVKEKPPQFSFNAAPKPSSLFAGSCLKKQPTKLLSCESTFFVHKPNQL